MSRHRHCDPCFKGQDYRFKKHTYNIDLEVDLLVLGLVLPCFLVILLFQMSTPPEIDPTWLPFRTNSAEWSWDNDITHICSVTFSVHYWIEFQVHKSYFTDDKNNNATSVPYKCKSFNMMNYLYLWYITVCLVAWRHKVMHVTTTKYKTNPKNMCNVLFNVF